jgi:adenylate cyclase
MERAHLKRRLTAVLIADIAGYSRLMSLDEEGTHLRLSQYLKTSIEPTIREHAGRLIRTAGDGFLAEFDSAVDAVYCALDIQHGLCEHNAETVPDRRLKLRIGINAGDVIAEEGDIYGNSVNIAARLEGLAEPGQIFVTRNVRDQLQGQPGILLEDRGERRVKNIKTPIRVYHIKRIQEQPKLALMRGIAARARWLVRTRLVPRWRSVTISGTALAVIVGVTVAALPFRPDYSVMSPRASIMVLPFRNASNDPEQDYFADAVTDNLTTDLSRLSDTSVISPATAFTYKGKVVDPRDIRREFGVRYLLQGSIRRAGLQVQTNAQLVETRSAAQIWADRFDNQFTDLFELQDAVTGRIASSLHVQLVKAEYRRSIAERPADPDAIDLRLRAMALLVSAPTPERALAARQHLEESVRLDPQSAESWSYLAWILVNDYLNNWNEAKQGPEAAKELLRRAEQAVQEAMRIDPTVARAHQADGYIRRAKGDHQGALDAFDRTIQLDPNYAAAHAQKANQLVMLGRPKEAPPLALKAITLSPRDPYVGAFYWVLGRAYFVMKNYDDAIIWLRKSAQVMPNTWYNRAYLLAAYALTGRHEQPEARTTASDYNSAFSRHTVQYITNLYQRDLPHPDPGMQASIQELYRGLRLAGVPEQ